MKKLEPISNFPYSFPLYGLINTLVIFFLVCHKNHIVFLYFSLIPTLLFFFYGIYLCLFQSDFFKINKQQNKYLFWKGP